MQKQSFWPTLDTTQEEGGADAEDFQPSEGDFVLDSLISTITLGWGLLWHSAGTVVGL